MGDMEDRVILDVMDDVFTLRKMKVSCLSLLEVSQEWGYKKGGNWRLLRDPDQRHGGQGHPRRSGCTW